MTELMTVAQVADLLQVERGTVHDYVQRGQIPVIRLTSRTLRFRRESLQWTC